MANTSNLNIPKIETLTSPTMDIHVNEMIDYIDANMSADLQGPLASRPPAGVAGRYFTATDQNPVATYRDNGSVWYPVTNHARGSVRSSYLADGAITMDKVTPKTITPTWTEIEMLPDGQDLEIRYYKDPFNIVHFTDFFGISFAEANVPLFDVGQIGIPVAGHVRTYSFEIRFSPSSSRWEFFVNRAGAFEAIQDFTYLSAT